MDERRTYATGAWIDLATIPLVVPAAPLGEAIGPACELLPIEGLAPGTHAVCVELCHVRDGRGEPGGMDQHAWSELAGFWWGAGAGLWMGAIAGAPGAAYGAAVGGAMGKDLARTMSETASRAIGTFREVKVFVPCVAPRGARAPHLYCLAMHTESRVSQRLSELYASGFGKRMASIAARDLESWEVRDANGQLLLAASLEAADAWRPANALPDFPTLAWLSQPLLGDLGGGRLTVSRLDRFYDDPRVQVAPARGCIALGDAFAPGLAAGEHAPHGAFFATSVPMKLTYPSPLPW